MGDGERGRVEAAERPVSKAEARSQLSDEMWRILCAVDEGRLSVNRVGRYVIEGEERPDRASRERLRSRGLIDHFYEQGRGSHWRVTARGKCALRDAGFGVRS